MNDTNESSRQEEKQEDEPVRAAAILKLLSGYTIWGCSFILTKTALNYAPDSIILASRFIIAFAVLNIMLLLKAGKLENRKRNIIPLVMVCITEPVYFVFETLALRYVTVTFESVVLSTTPVFAMLTAFVLLHERPTKRQILCCFTAVFGIIIVTLNGKEIGAVNGAGLIIIAAACLVSSIYRTYNKKSGREFSTFERTYYIIGSCTLFFTIRAILEIKGDFSVWAGYIAIPQVIWPIVLLALFCSFIAQLLVNSSVRDVSVLVFSILALFQTVVAVLTGVVLLHDPVNIQMAFGIILTLLSMAGVSINRKIPVFGRKRLRGVLRRRND